MKEERGNVWTHHKRGYWAVITTNGSVRTDGAAVMGRGVARQAAVKYPDLPFELGTHIKDWGNTVGIFQQYMIITLPVKHHWQSKANLELIETSIKKLRQVFGFAGMPASKIYMVRPGCGYGRLDWADVRPILEKHLDDRFIVVEQDIS